MERTTRFSKQYQVELRDVGFNKKLKWSTLFSYFQDTASDAVNNLGIGIDDLRKKYNVAWILVKIKAEIIRDPGWNERITVETWPQEPKSLEFERDFYVRDEEGTLLVKANSSWIILDLKTRKIKRSSAIETNYPSIITERALDCSFKKLGTFGNREIAYKKTVGYSDIDFNGHLNNSRYVDYISDCFTVEQHNQFRVQSIEVNFVSEALAGETIILYKDVSQLNNHLVYIEGVNEKNGQLIFKALIEIA